MERSLGPPPGSAEYLATLLTGPEYGCPHTAHYLQPGVKSKIPPRLGFFHASRDDDELSYIDTNKLCQACYNKALPRGFLAWSAFYMRGGVNIYREGQEYFASGRLAGRDPDMFPAQIQAGKERFGERTRHRPATTKKAHDMLGPSEADLIPRDDRYVFIPKNEDTRAAWKFFQTAKQPFYMDLLHVHPPYRDFVEQYTVKHGKPGRYKLKQLEMQVREENERIAQANAPAYLGARYVINAVPEGGYGPYTIAEQRLAQYGSYRLVPLGQYSHNKENAAGIELATPLSTNSETENPAEDLLRARSDMKNVVEVDPRWYPGQGATAYRGGEFMYYATDKHVGRLVKDVLGKPLAPDADEQNRRAYEGEYPEYESPRDRSKSWRSLRSKSPAAPQRHWRLPQLHTVPDPPPDVQMEAPAPRITDVDHIIWHGEQEWRMNQGLESLELGGDGRVTTTRSTRPSHLPLFNERTIKRSFDRRDINAAGEMAEESYMKYENIHGKVQHTDKPTNSPRRWVDRFRKTPVPAPPLAPLPRGRPLAKPPLMTYPPIDRSSHPWAPRLPPSEEPEVLEDAAYMTYDRDPWEGIGVFSPKRSPPPPDDVELKYKQWDDAYTLRHKEVEALDMESEEDV